MDPLSLTASIVAVTTVAVQVGKLLTGLHEDWEALPGRVHALNNEIQDFTVVLNQVNIAAQERRLSHWGSRGHLSLHAVLARAEVNLLDIKAILDKIVASSGSRKKAAIPRLLIWRKEQGRLAALQEMIRQVKSSLNVILGASNSHDMMHVRLQLEELSLKVQGPFPSYDEPAVPNGFIEALFQEHNKSVKQSLHEKYAQVDARIDRVEAMTRTQSTAMHTSQIQQIGPLYSASAPPARQNAVRQVSPVSAARIRANSTSVRVRLRQAQATCHPGCCCACHTERSATSPSFLHRMLGQVFIGYCGLPLLSSNCDRDNCARKQIPTATMEYWFPLGFCWSQIVRLHLAYDANTGPSLQLSTLRQVSDSAPCVGFALNGNTEGLKNLFQQGLASPRDWALYGQQYETCKFLMIAGADPTYRPIAKSDDCPSDKAGDIILRGNLTRATTEILRIMAEGSDYIERQNFNELHIIVLGLCSQDLEKTIRKRPHEVDVPDAAGRTPLQWAAARGDERAVITLLSWGADANHMDNKFNTPLTLAANQNQVICVRLLLEAGALPDPQLPKGTKFGTPLNCAARNASDPMVMKTLLDFDANIEATGVDGVTPLLHVARSSSATHAMLLLEYGANINAKSRSNQSPLTAAIQCNNHAVLKLLLERWSDNQQCPRLEGPYLLDIVAHSLLDLRSDNSDELNAAFEELRSVLRADAASDHDVASQMEQGLFQAFSDQDTESDGSAFEDAKERF
ncbi:ankyrin repeat containing protein [Cordyceps fumosorosea ARSEF 2679]|uniref:Ankyrin repeat containing protein n=1 Tax=Cordyceps fumosorosea (strain ARSEF 2679) TaxID=1081104 RepID=A0A162K3S6_CORFA|nr:ankyrin repeat containing protein [Cordyceps fumosorosea ARSEF 2679]OAA52958.1 ankyrin repeat containing protein [Cordyceps fumosorosea ARSEF 2679]